MNFRSSESVAFWVTFIATFFAVAIWESKRPNRAWSVPTGKRWGVHGLLTIVDALLRMVILPVTPVAMAAYASSVGRWGLAANLPLWLVVPFTVLALDLTKFFVHRLYHALPWLWRIHRVHHSDPDYDVATGSRFHPLEVVIGQAADVAVVYLIAPPAVAVIVARLVSTVINNVQHANADFAPGWESRLRRWVMTPALHRTHHSDRMGDQLSNYGELVPWWDKVAGTYRDRPEAGEADMQVGVTGYQQWKGNGLLSLLTQPLRPIAQPDAEPDAEPIMNVRTGQPHPRG